MAPPTIRQVRSSPRLKMSLPQRDQSPSMLKHLVSLLLAVTLAAASEAPPLNGMADSRVESSPAEFTFYKQVHEVHLAFTALDHGRPVTDLRKDDIALWNDGRPVAGLTAFYHHDELPLRIIVLVDASDSMKTLFTEEQDAANRFPQGVVRGGKDQAAVEVFAAKLCTEPTGARRLKNAAFMQLHAEGQTALYDALHNAVQQLSAKDEGEPVRRVIILLSDGEDNWSRHSAGEVVEAAQQGDIAIYAITAHSRRLEFAGDRVLESLADSTGGRAFLVNRFEHADGAFREIEEELRAQYLAGFRPSSGGNAPGHHTITVAVKGRKLKVRAREGYFVATP